MNDWIFVKIYFLLCFVFLFTLSMWRFFHIEFLYLIIIIYWVLILPLKYIFSNYFEKIKLVKKIIIFTTISIVSYFVSFDITSFLLLLFYSFFIVFKINYDNLFYFWILTFFLFIFSYIFWFDIKIYSSFFAFSLYSFFIWIIYYLFSYLNLDRFFRKNYNIYFKVLFILFFALFLFSLYYHSIIISLVYLLFFLLFVLDHLKISDLKIDYRENYYLDISIFSLFFIIFIPIINDFLKIEQKNFILLSTFISFLIVYIWFNLVIKLIKK